ncbi:dynein light chain intermediate polypeptide [Thraustotheca clavata]|uniref:Dynein light chain intermediate polypeptide n=1 Tax=Thraustotheca clavata TaxID=74557 RepID=A0A1V9YQA3_9STRA|nr:dynein light chain intermediate polypeptide [Thraustotheca clavata]
MAEPCPPESLVSYDAPIFTGESNEGVKKAKTAPGTKVDPVARIEDVLNAMLPPQVWREDTGYWMRYTSAEPSTRFDVIKLQVSFEFFEEQMDAKLIKRQARESGICPVREDIYAQCFDELIREVAINSPERGLLLLRIRDEIRMTTDAYKTLYESSITFGVRKQLQAEQGMGSLEDKIAALTEEKREYENKVLELTNKLEVIEKRSSERRSLQEKRYKEEIEFLKYQGQHLDAFLKSAGGGAAK